MEMEVYVTVLVAAATSALAARAFRSDSWSNNGYEGEQEASVIMKTERKRDSLKARILRGAADFSSWLGTFTSFHSSEFLILIHHVVVTLTSS